MYRNCVCIYIERERKKERCLFSLGISQLAMFDDCCGCCVWNLPKKKSKNIGTEKGAPATQLGWGFPAWSHRSISMGHGFHSYLGKTDSRVKPGRFQDPGVHRKAPMPTSTATKASCKYSFIGLV